MKNLDKLKLFKISLKNYISETEEMIQFIGTNVGREINLQVKRRDDAIIMPEDYAIDNLLKKNTYSFTVVYLYNNLEFHLGLTLTLLGLISSGSGSVCIKRMNCISSLLKDPELKKKWQVFIDEINLVGLFRNIIVHNNNRCTKPYPKEFQHSYFERQILNQLSADAKKEMLIYYKKNNSKYIMEDGSLYSGFLDTLFINAKFDLQTYIITYGSKKAKSDYNNYLQIKKYFEKKCNLLECNQFLFFPKIEYLEELFQLIAGIYSFLNDNVLI